MFHIAGNVRTRKYTVIQAGAADLLARADVVVEDLEVANRGQVRVRLQLALVIDVLSIDTNDVVVGVVKRVPLVAHHPIRQVNLG